MSAEKKLRLDGLYTSSTCFERLDMSRYCHYFHFYPDDRVRKGYALVPINVDQELQVSSNIGKGSYVLEGNKIIFDITDSTGFTSHWIGSLAEAGITFSIENPDFEDISGLYAFKRQAQS